MNVGYLITARLKSTRLPKKLLREVQGKPILSHMLDRLKLAGKVDRIVICTSTNPQDAPLMDIAGENDVGCYCGDPDDVIARLSGAAEENDFDYVLNITGDCPFVDPMYVDRIVEAYERTGADLIRVFDLPHGAFSYGIRPEALKKILEIKQSNDTEVWGRYFTDTDLFHVYDLPVEDAFHRKPHLRMTLDYPEDLAFFETVFEHLYKEGSVFSLDDILHLLEEHPEIIELNRDCKRRFQKRFNSQSKIRLKQRYNVARAAVIGCGSIGQRHIRNLRSLGITDIVALRSNQGHFQNLPPELGVREVDGWSGLFAENPDIAIVSNPTSLHLETFERLIPHVKGIFIEKPLSDSLKGVNELLEKINRDGVISFVGYNLQFHPAIKAIRHSLDSNLIGQPLVFQCQAGHWLPDWHPYEDFREGYYARKDLGGGVTLTLIHEIHLAIALMGNVQEVFSIYPKNKTLPVEVDTVADLMTRHDSGAVSQIHLDYIQRPFQRSGTISGEKGWIRYDLANPRVMAQFAGDSSPLCLWDGAEYEANQQYVDEMDTFLDYVREGRVRHPFDASNATKSLAVADAALNCQGHGTMLSETN
jgi:spore coat polysaccharide biosynthesis protein SpsF